MGPHRQARRTATTSATSRRPSNSRTAWSWCSGPRARSGGQWDIWEAVFSPVGADGYPQPHLGQAHRRHRQDGRRLLEGALRPRRHILQRDWESGLGTKLQGKIHIYVGDTDNYYLNNAVYLAEDFLKSTTNPPYGGEVDYGHRAEHCWNGDHTRAERDSRLRYHQMFAPKIVERILKTAPPGGDVTSWRY